MVVLLNGIFRRARKVWKLPQNPVADVERLSVPKRTDIEFYSPEEVHALVRASAEEQDGALFLTAAMTGPRMGELLSRTRGSHRQYRHPQRPGKVTVPGKPSSTLHPKTLASILRQAGMEKP